MNVKVDEVSSALSVHTHHSEGVDPTLAGWIRDLLDSLLGWGPWTFVVVFGIAIAVVPLWLIYTAIKHPPETEVSETNEE